MKQISVHESIVGAYRSRHELQCGSSMPALIVWLMRHVVTPVVAGGCLLLDEVVIERREPRHTNVTERPPCRLRQLRE